MLRRDSLPGWSLGRAVSLGFTEYIRSMESGGDVSDPDLFEALWKKLRGALIAELKKRALWSAPPSYLGIYGAASWRDPDALDELVTDCFTFVFLSRLPGLKAQLRVKDNIEGLVFRSIQNFLYDTQKRHDPLGFRVFVVLQNALRQAITAGVLHVLRGDPGVGNETVLAFAPGSEGGQARGAELREHVRGWNDDLLPDLITARGKGQDGIITRLSAHISRLPTHGIGMFRFKDLIDLLKSDARARWNVIWRYSEGETAIDNGDADDDFVVIVRQVRPDSGVEERESFEKLIICVTEAVERIAGPAQTKIYMERLWGFLTSHAAEPTESQPAADPADPKAYKLPSRRKIAKLLGIPRDRLAELHATLGGLVDGCRAASSGKPQLGRKRKQEHRSPGGSTAGRGEDAP